MSLNSRIIAFATVLLLIGSAGSWLVFQRVAETIIEQWGLRVAEVQVRYDSARLLQPLEREIALARQMADSSVLRRWAREPDDEELTAAAIDEMESFRRNFHSSNYFVALSGNGAYYHNNESNEYDGSQFRYTLNPERPADAWFFKLIEDKREFHLNVNPDAELGVTKLWIDMMMRDGDEILAILGTGLDLETVLSDIVDIDQPGITTLFVDHDGAIQLYRDPEYIDFASLLKSGDEANTIELLLDLPGDHATVQRMMKELAAQESDTSTVLTTFVLVEGKRHLAGIAYLPGIDWYEITLIDLDVLMPIRHFTPVALVFVLGLLIALLLFHQAMRWLVLNPLASLESAMLRVRDGDLRPPCLPRGQAEIGRLIGHFGAMAESIRSHTEDLEQRVEERTQALHQLARIDALTELGNRRNMTERLEHERLRAQRTKHRFGLIWLDLDNFKQLNDGLGHGAGDQTLIAIANVLRACIRPYDLAARWGGDEFLVLLSPCDDTALEEIAERIRARVEKELGGTDQAIPITISIGATLIDADDPVEAALHRADQALYQAKDAGRNTIRLASKAEPS